MQLYKRTVITRGYTDIPYLIRYSLFSCRFFAVKLHHILVSDDDCLHDHPWSFLSILLRGAYLEESTNDARLYQAPAILFRKAEWKHRLVIGKPVWSFVITFKKVREWGFWTKVGFVPWYKFHSNLCDDES